MSKTTQGLFILVFSSFLAGCNSSSVAVSTQVGATSLSNDQRATAAASTANSNSYCTAIFPFYWEIGDKNNVLASGSVGDGSVVRTSTFSVASSSKWVFGAYVIQRLNGVLDATTQKFLKMMSGYHSMGTVACVNSTTVQDCFNSGTNSQYTAADDGSFYYNGGHFQKWGVDNGMGPMTTTDLTNEYTRYLGNDFVMDFDALQLAGGVQTSAQYYAVFLQKILNNELLISQFLGVNPTCTLPGSCATAVSSPIPEAWHYSYGHWIEDDPSTGGDGAFSSAGLYGFYPWIDATKTYYGILSRKKNPPLNSNEIGNGYASAECGRLIRKAFMTGTAQ